VSRSDKLALLLSLAGFLAALLVANRVFERMAHIEDEMAIAWQAQAIAGGNLTLTSPEFPESYLVPFVIDHNGQRFGKYPIGWPALLAVGIRLGARHLVNPLLAGLAVWLTYRLGKKALNELVGLLAAGLTLASPFFLMNAGSLLSHPFGLVLSAAFALAWLDGFWDAENDNRRLPAKLTPAITAGLLLGLSALTRPLTTLGIAIPFGLHGLYLLWKGSKAVRIRVLMVGGIALLLGGFHYVWQAAVTGDMFTNPYTLWWEYDKVGFGEGFGRHGHNLRIAWANLRVSLRAGTSDLFGWGTLSWLFLPFGLWAVRKNRGALLLSSVFFSLVGVYLAYWIGSWLFGPRYYFEGLYSLTLLTAVGMCWLAGWPLDKGEPFRQRAGRHKLRPLGVAAAIALLASANLLFYLPVRLGGMHGLYGIERARLAYFESAPVQKLAPALIIVHPDHWTDYGNLLELQDAYLQNPLIFVTSRRANNAGLTALMEASGRNVYHYYSDEPGKLYLTPRPLQTP
jgi:4-amino-4-deoxy-L-arabinose transferase-like glycosyltransferase